MLPPGVTLLLVNLVLHCKYGYLIHLHYTAEEKAKIVVEVLKSEYTLAELSGKYEAHANQLHRWKQSALEAVGDKFKRKFKDKDDSQAELIKTLLIIQ